MSDQHLFRFDFPTGPNAAILREEAMRMENYVPFARGRIPVVKQIVVDVRNEEFPIVVAPGFLLGFSLLSEPQIPPGWPRSHNRSRLKILTICSGQIRTVRILVSGGPLMLLPDLAQEIAAYRDGRISLDQFENWFRDNSRGMFGDPPEVLQACLSIDAAFVELRDGGMSLQDFATSWLKPCVHLSPAIP